MRTLRRTLALAAAVVVALPVAGCARPVSGTPRAVGEIDTRSVGGKPVTDGPSGPREGVPDAKLGFEGGDGSEMDRLAVNALSDIYDYWTEQLPANFDGDQFQPLKRLVSYDSDGTAVKICQQSTAGLVNAFYCGQDDSIAWDRGRLLPLLDKQFGPMSVVTVLAHEMGHAIQFRLLEKSNIDQTTATILKEQQADCYAGNFFAWVADGKAKHFQLSSGPGLNQVLATMFFIRDPAGLSANTRGAHGLAFDRVFAFQEGYTKGPRRCAQMDANEIKNRIAEKVRDEQDEKTKGEVAIDDQKVFEEFKKSLDEAFKGNQVTPPQIKTNGARCDSGKATSPVAYCPDQNVVAMDLNRLKQIATPPKRDQTPGQDGAGIGDFAAFAEVVSRYTLGIQKSLGGSLEGEDAGLRTACLTGAWAGFVDKPQPGTHLRLSVGDLDEAVAELLRDNSLIAADVTGKQTPVGFTRVEAFRVGYFEGSHRCTTLR